MNHRDLTRQLSEDALGKFNAEVVVIDGEGFTHIPMGVFWDPEYHRWVIRTRFQTDDKVTLNGPGYPAQ